MNKQEIFEKVAIHLLTQNEQAATSGGTCLYRTSSGLKCSVGCLINDDLYHPSIEGYGVTSTPVKTLLEESGVEWSM